MRDLRSIHVGAATLIAASIPTTLTAQTQTLPSSVPGLELRMDALGHRARAYAEAGEADAAASNAALADLPSGWEAFGPYGGDADDVVVSPSVAGLVFAGLAAPDLSNGGVAISGDGGESWTQVPELAGTPVHDLEFAANGSLYVGSLDSVWKSDDDGQTFVQLDLGIGVQDQVLEVTTHPTDALVVWAGVADALGGQPANVLFSGDGGQTWIDRTPVLAAGTGCTAIALDPADPNRVFAAFSDPFGGGTAVLFSPDAGTTWFDRTGSLPTGAPLADLAHDGTRLLVAGGQAYDGQDFGLFETTDEGQSWTPLHDGTWPSLAITDIEVHPFQAGTLLLASAGAGVHRSLDGGANWIFGVAGTEGRHVSEVCADPVQLLGGFAAGSTFAVAKSTDGALTFEPSATGIRALNTVAILTHGIAGGELAMCFNGLNTGGIYTSGDGGETWQPEPVPATRWNEIEFAPDGKLLAVSAGPVTTAQEGVWRRTPNGWVAMGPDQGPLYETDLVNLEIGKTTLDIVAVGRDFGPAGDEATMWRFPNQTGPWTKVYEGSEPGETVTEVFYFDHGGDQIVVAAVRDDGPNQTGGVLRSVDFGQSWGPVSGIPATAQCSGFTFSPTSATWAFVADDSVGPGAGGVYFTADQGLTWVKQPGTSGPVSRIVGDPLRPGELYASRTSATPKVEKTTDDGVTFAPYDAGLDPLVAIGDAVYWEGVNSVQFEQCDYLMLATSGGLWRRNIHCALDADVDAISVSSGGVQNFVYSLGPKHAGELYFLLGSASGTEPGIPVESWTLPLNLDAYLQFTAKATGFPLSGSVGVFDSTGFATAQLTLPPGLSPSLVGTQLHHAYLTIDFTGIPFVQLVSNACPLDLLP